MKKLFSLFLLLCLCGTVCAAEIYGSITVTAPAGGNVTLYQAALWNGTAYTPCPGFESWEFGLGDLQSPDFAADLAAFILEAKIPGVTLEIGPGGTVTFKDLEPGLYLLVQSQAAPGFSAFSPFFVGIPQEIGNTTIYDVSASPKVTPQPTEPSSGPTPVTGDRTDIPLLLSLTFLSGGGLILLLLAKKKSR